MMNGPYTPTVSLMNNGSTSTITASVNMPPQRTPPDIREYLTSMGFAQTAVSGSEMWANNLGYYTWEQAVVYCLIKPFLNP